MRKQTLLIMMLAALAGCKTTNKTTTRMEKQDEKTANTAAADTTPKVTGVGGIFFFSDDPKQTREWYSRNLGIETNDYGASFETKNADKPGQVDVLQWTPFKKGSNYFAPSTREFMINYRVQNIEGLVRKLKDNGVTILDDIATYDYGKFVHILDADGNKIELWEPAQTKP